ncbi:hypothetical protein [Serratia fonticola]|uniref:hypothetical protein n=1 Tax=Serratia fonticola TaxID=47917 RepID=UPI000E0F7ABA|nr:hypothetical protein [Serratia fonticola]RDL15596.1 hypothetical protein DFO62_1236 [Serratia fonticola]
MRIKRKRLLALQRSIVMFFEIAPLMARGIILLLIALGIWYLWLAVSEKSLQYGLLSFAFTIPGRFMMSCRNHRDKILRNALLEEADVLGLKKEFMAYLAQYDASNSLTMQTAAKWLMELYEKKEKNQGGI